MEMLYIKYIITEIKKSMDGLNSKMKRTEETNSKLENSTIEIVQSKQQKKID